jgi:hypothetical protein
MEWAAATEKRCNSQENGINMEYGGRNNKRGEEGRKSPNNAASSGKSRRKGIRKDEECDTHRSLC